MRRLLADLPPGEPVDASGDDAGVRFELLAHGVRAGRMPGSREAAAPRSPPARPPTPRHCLALAQRRARRESAVYHPAAAVALATGQRDLALELCRLARRTYCPTFLELERDPALAALHGDPQFRALFDDLAAEAPLARGDDDGRVYVREHVVVAFFVPGRLGRHAARLAPKLLRVLDAYLAYLPAGALAHGLVGVHATRGDDTRPFDDKLLARVRQQLAPARLASNADTHVELFGPGDDNAPYHLELSGDDDDDANVIAMRFPPEFVEDKGLAAFRAWVETVSTYVPYTYGFATRALTPESYYSSDATMHARLTALARWHAGLDAVELVELRVRLADRVPGAKWLTFLDHKKLRRLGGVDALARGLEPHGVRVAALANGAVVQAGDAPDRGRGAAFANREQLRRVHAALSPVISLAWNLNGALEGYPGGVDGWLRRYLDDLALPAPANPILRARSARPGL
ncbi:MAG: DUF3396 domain-containing protein [Deltaproteobacteria bacterium]|nr:DUF3396 domain-containing protein [Deltaproteobacteria bacterium]